MMKVKIEDVLKLLPGSVGVGSGIRYKYIHYYLPPGSGVCLDAGCGPNPESRMFPYIRDRGYTPVGIDNDPNWRDPQVTFGDIRHTPFPNDHFTAIVSVDSLYVPPKEAFTEFYRVLKPSGVVVIHAPLPLHKQRHILQNLITELKDKEKAPSITRRVHQKYEDVHRQWYDVGELQKIGVETGFSRVDEIKAWGFFDNIAYDIRYIAGFLEKDQERLRRISVIAWLISLLEDMDAPKKRFMIGLVTRMFK